MKRRQFLIGAGAILGSKACASVSIPRVSGAGSLARLERVHGGRLGICVLDTGTGQALHHRADERFPFCSTIKSILAAAVLGGVDAGKMDLGKIIRYSVDDVLDYAPMVRANLPRGEMAVGELCDAMVTVSDNSAANLILRELGGVGEVNAYLRSMGDSVTRLDRNEPGLNEALPGDPRDTSTPRAMAGTIRQLFLGDALSKASRTLLVDWHRRVATGKARLRAGIPLDWGFVHKTGTGEHGATNDVGVAWPPSEAPMIFVGLFVDSGAPLSDREFVLAEVARIGRTSRVAAR